MRSRGWSEERGAITAWASAPKPWRRKAMTAAAGKAIMTSPRAWVWAGLVALPFIQRYYAWRRETRHLRKRRGENSSALLFGVPTNRAIVAAVGGVEVSADAHASPHASSAKERGRLSTRPGAGLSGARRGSGPVEDDAQLLLFGVDRARRWPRSGRAWCDGR